MTMEETPSVRSELEACCDAVLRPELRDSTSAWLFGIIRGWAKADLDCLAQNFGWTEERKATLRRLHRQFRKAFAKKNDLPLEPQKKAKTVRIRALLGWVALLASHPQMYEQLIGCPVYVGTQCLNSVGTVELIEILPDRPRITLRLQPKVAKTFRSGAVVGIDWERESDGDYRPTDVHLWHYIP